MPELSQDGEMQKLAITHRTVQTLQVRFALVTVLIPCICSIIAVALLIPLGIGVTEIALLFGLYLLSAIGIEIGFHRYFSHAAFQAATPIRVFLLIFGSIAAEGPLIQWVATHRRHHQYTDQLGDPHSPHTQLAERNCRLNGLWHAHVGWLFKGELTNTSFYAKDLIQDVRIANLNRFYLLWVILGLVFPTVVDGLITWSWLGVFKGFLWGGMVRIFLAHHCSWTVNSINHFWGNRYFNTSDQSTNNLWLALPTIGGSWHNNHHTFPHSATNSFTWWQLDPGIWVIQILQAIGLVWDIKQPTTAMITAKRLLKHDSNHE